FKIALEWRRSSQSTIMTEAPQSEPAGCRLTRPNTDLPASRILYFGHYIQYIGLGKRLYRLGLLTRGQEVDGFKPSTSESSRVAPRVPRSVTRRFVSRQARPWEGITIPRSHCMLLTSRNTCAAWSGMIGTELQS